MTNRNAALLALLWEALNKSDQFISGAWSGMSFSDLPPEVRAEFEEILMEWVFESLIDGEIGSYEGFNF